MSNILVFAQREWSFKNIEPALKGIDYDRATDVVDTSNYDFFITCEPCNDMWKEMHRKLKGKKFCLAIQQGMLYDSKANPNATWYFDKILLWGEQAKETCLRHGLSEDKMIVTGNPRFDYLFDLKPQDDGYTLILGSGGECRDMYGGYLGDNVVFQPHPNVVGYKLSDDTEDLILKAHKVIFRNTGAGIMAMILNKPVKILNINPKDKEFFIKSKLYNNGFGVDEEFVKWAVGGPGAIGIVKSIIDSYIKRSQNGSCETKIS